MKDLGTSRSHQKFDDRVVQSARTGPLVDSLGIAESHVPKHRPTATTPLLSLVIFYRDGTLIEDTGFPVDPKK
jgi:hypothetical protein